MKLKDIEHNNILIATFSGGGRTKDVIEHYDETWIKYVDTDSLKGTIEKISDLRYHMSWAWLMPIVEKIRTTVHVTKGYKVIIENNKTTINDIYDDLVCEYKGEDSLQNTYKCVVEFIKWYNIK